jgi:hypothetical protein
MIIPLPRDTTDSKRDGVTLCGEAFQANHRQALQFRVENHFFKIMSEDVILRQKMCYPLSEKLNSGGEAA